MLYMHVFSETKRPGWTKWRNQSPAIPRPVESGKEWLGSWIRPDCQSYTSWLLVFWSDLIPSLKWGVLKNVWNEGVDSYYCNWCCSNLWGGLWCNNVRMSAECPAANSLVVQLQNVYSNIFFSLLYIQKSYLSMPVNSMHVFPLSSSVYIQFLLCRYTLINRSRNHDWNLIPSRLEEATQQASREPSKNTIPSWEPHCSDALSASEYSTWLTSGHFNETGWNRHLKPNPHFPPMCGIGWRIARMLQHVLCLFFLRLKVVKHVSNNHSWLEDSVPSVVAMLG